MTKTFNAKPEEVDRNWIVIDLEGKTLGRAATAIARILRGKNKPQYTPHVDTGDFVVVVNADKVYLSGKKKDVKHYHQHSDYPGGFRSFTVNEMLQRKPEEVIRHAVKGMLPKNSLGRKLLKKLKIYTTAEHPHAAQQPTPLEID